MKSSIDLSEARAARFLISLLVSEGYVVSAGLGYKADYRWLVQRSSDVRDLCSAVTPEEEQDDVVSELRVFNAATGEPVGEIALWWGSGPDNLISDWRDIGYWGLRPTPMEELVEFFYNHRRGFTA